jgi:predicted dehydrogenase
MNQRPIRVAVAGTNHGLSHVLEVLGNPRFELVAICDRNERKLAELRGEKIEHPDEQPWFTAHRTALLDKVRAYPQLQRARLVPDFDRLVEMTDVDAVIIALPVHVNAQLAIKSLQAGKHTYTSKPFALTLADATELRNAVLGSGLAFANGFQFRYAPLFKQIRRAITDGYLGDVRQLWWNMTRLPLRPAFSRRDLSGGAYFAECCHWFDVIDYLVDGRAFTKVAAFGGLDLPDTHVDLADNAVTIVEYQGGFRASVNFTYFTDQPEFNTFGLQGTDGKIRGDTDRGGSYVMFAGKGQDKTEFAVNPAHAYSSGPHQHLGFDVAHNEFARQIETGDRAAAAIQAESGFENVLICLAAEQALDTGRIVTRDEVASSPVPARSPSAT